MNTSPFTRSHSSGRVRVLAIILAALLLAALAGPLAAAPARGGDAPTAAYTLRGDASNRGSSATSFISSQGTSGMPTWLFGSTSSSGGTITLRSFCTAGNCTAFESEGQGKGINGIADGDNGFGVIGTHDSTSGTAAGVRGITHSGADYATALEGIVSPYGSTVGASSVGVVGHNTGTSNEGIGVWGAQDGSGWGVYGVTNGAGRGVYGQSAGIGVYGYSSGTTSGTRGVYGRADGGQGVYGSSTNGTGGIFRSSNGDGLLAYTSSSDSYALVTGGMQGLSRANGDAYINGDLHVTGACCALVATDAGTRQMYATEATAATFSDEGTATLVKGRAVITLDSLFAQATGLDAGYQVFLTPHSADTLGLAAINLTATGFEVRELKGGEGSFAFSWRVDARRKGYEQVRMAPAPAAPAALTRPDEPLDVPTTQGQGGLPK